MTKVTLHLRSETKPLEHRSAREFHTALSPVVMTQRTIPLTEHTVTPTTTRTLIENGFTINVERSPVRIFDDTDFANAGATLVDEGSWPDAPADHIIIGLKELEDRDPFPLKHVHIAFAHCYKKQAGWQDVLSRYSTGGGMLYDMEFLESDKRRVAAFGYHAGYAGAALALQAWARQISGLKLEGREPYAHKSELDEEVRRGVREATEKLGRGYPTVLIIGALGRCGRGAIEMCREAGLPDENLRKWDMAETAKGGPFEEIRAADIFINCIYLDKEIPKFITTDFLQQGPRNLSVVCDVSCDTTNPNNPIPFCCTPTYFNAPTITLEDFSAPPLSYITIDHLPSLLPREASEAFSNDLLPFLLQLPQRGSAPVWVGAEKLFREKVWSMPRELRGEVAAP